VKEQHVHRDRPRHAVITGGRALIAISAISLVALGCGDGRPTRVPVAGRVTIDGQPVTRGAISFMPVNGPRPAGGQLDSEGKFVLTLYEKGDGVPEGKYRVAVTGVEYIGETAQKWHAPKRYSSVETSELKVNIDGPQEDLVIDLTWDGGKPFVEKL
jgi:hypothetical protein